MTFGLNLETIFSILEQRSYICSRPSQKPVFLSLRGRPSQKTTCLSLSSRQKESVHHYCRLMFLFIVLELQSEEESEPVATPMSKSKPMAAPASNQSL